MSLTFNCLLAISTYMTKILLNHSIFKTVFLSQLIVNSILLVAKTKNLLVILYSFLSHPTWNPSRNPLCTTFKVYAESHHFSSFPQVVAWSKSPSFLVWVIKTIFMILLLLPYSLKALPNTEVRQFYSSVLLASHLIQNKREIAYGLTMIKHLLYPLWL